MKMKYIIISFLLAMLMSGCGSNNSDVVASVENDTSSSEITDTDNSTDTNGTVSISFINGVFSKELTLNGEVARIEVLVYSGDNSPHDEGEISIAYPEKVKTGVDVGSFAIQTVAVEDGKAVFSYTAPNDLQERVDANDKSTIFSFYLASDPLVSEDFTFNYNPTSDQTSVSTYKLEQTLASESYTMPLESTIDMSFSVSGDDKNLDDSDIVSMKIKLLNPSLAELQDRFNNSGDELSFTVNNVSVNLISNTISGIVPIEVTVSFLDVNGKTQTLVSVFNTTILSGPPTAMSISYEGTAHDEANVKFQEAMVITVVDKYFNRVNTSPAVSSYLIAGYTLENNSDLNTRLYFNTTSAKSATMSPSNNTLTSTADFSNVDPNNDILMTFGNGYTYNVSGKWDIESVNGGVLTLSDKIDAPSSVSNMGFAVGHNYRQDTCRDSREWVGYVTLESDRLNSNGMVKAIINYDYYLTGKVVTLGVDIVGYTATGDVTSKFGESIGHTLRSVGLEAANTCDIPAGAVGVACTISLKIAETGEWYRNSDVGYTLKVSDKVSATRVSGQGDDVHDCTASGGVVYETFSVTNSDLEATGSVEMEDIVIGSEF